MKAILVAAGLALVGLPAPVAHADGARVVVSGDTITLVDASGSRSVAVTDLESVAVRTGERGPLDADVTWVLRTAAMKLEFSSGLPGAGDLLPLFGSRLPGFDHQKLVEASATSGDATFVCWTKAGGGK